MTSYPAYWGHWDGGGPGWWLIFPILFWTLVPSVVGYLIYSASPGRSARTVAERTLAEQYARGEITEQEPRQRQAVLRERS